MNKNVLIVDDFEPNILVLESILEDMPINIMKASNGEDALRTLLNERVDLILLDIKLPDINGFEIGKLIRGNKKNKHLPIIFLSGLADQEYSKFIEQYPDKVDFFQKPFNADAVKERVNHYITNH
jgi:response regulator RpfG family c-di-GMP phosphodiesterase